MKESKIYGLSACQMFAEKRAEKIIRAYFSDKVAKKFASTMKLLAQKKKVYRIVTEEDLQKLSKSIHHEGVCFVVEPVRALSLSAALSQKKKRDIILFLDDISNPHNLGAIMRVCAHFGVSHIIHSQPQLLQSGAAMRNAEGGAESLSVVECSSVEELLQEAQKNKYVVYSTSSHQGKSIYEIEFPSHLILMLGGEGHGLSENTIRKTKCLKIPGTNSVESLNVATASAVLLSEVWRQKGHSL